jgi:hypothetical protein
MAIVVVVIVLLALGRFGLVTVRLRFTTRRSSALLRTGAWVRTPLPRYADLFRPLVWRGGPTLVGATPGLIWLRGLNGSLGTDLGLLLTLVLRRRPALVAITPLPATGG